MTKRLEISPENPEGILVDLTAEEISQKETDKAEYETQKAQADTDAEAKADLKASAKAKLIAGEALTEEEADTIVL